MTGANRVARAAPDGYQIVIGVTGTHVENQSLYKKPLYNAATDFAAVGLIAEGPYILITRKDLPAADLKKIRKTTRKRTGARCSSDRPARARELISLVSS